MATEAVRPAGLTSEDVRSPVVEEESDLRPKNQVTVPRRIAKALGLQPGDRLIFEIREKTPHEIRVRRLRRDYTGALAGIYGTAEEAAAYLRSEREAWGD